MPLYLILSQDSRWFSNSRTRGKFHLVEAFVSNNTDIFCISETFLDSSVNGISDELNISDYTLVQIDDPFQSLLL